MHREIQIKHFPIVTTHWWPKTRNERFVWENEQYLYRFLPLVHNHVQVIWVHTHPVCARALAHAWRRACLKRGADATFQAPMEASANQIASCKYPIQFMQHQRSMWLVVVTMTARQHHASDTPSVKRWRRRARARAHTHVTHRMCAALRSLGHGCVQEVKNDINTVRFLTQTARSCLRPSMCSYDGELFNLDFSVHVLFPSYRDGHLYLPLYDWQTRTVWPKNIKIGSTEEKKTPTSWMPLG